MAGKGIETAPPGFSWLTFLTLALVLGLSVAIFAALVQRWTRSRLWVDIATWARRRGYRAKLDLDAPPPPLDHALPEAPLQIVAAVYNDRGGYLRLESGAGHDAPATRTTATPSRWHILVRRIDTTWPATGLRPGGAEGSFVDFYSLGSFPLMGEAHRFVVYGTDSAAARRLSGSSIRSLLPPDVGMLLIGSHLLLDFSSRPFDSIEFERLEALASSVASHLPA